VHYYEICSLVDRYFYTAQTLQQNKSLKLILSSQKKASIKFNYKNKFKLNIKKEIYKHIFGQVTFIKTH